MGVEARLLCRASRVGCRIELGPKPDGGTRSREPPLVLVVPQVQVVSGGKEGRGEGGGEEGRKGGMEGWRKGGREERRKGGKERGGRGREKGREEGRKG